MLSGQTSVTVSSMLSASPGHQTVIVSLISLLAWFAPLRTYPASRPGLLFFMTPNFGVASGAAIPE